MIISDEVPSMKSNECGERGRGAGQRRILVCFEVECVAAIPIRAASAANGVHQSAASMPRVLVGHTMDLRRLILPDTVVRLVAPLPMDRCDMSPGM